MYYNIAMICFCAGIAVYDIKTFRIPDIALIAFAVVMIIMEGSQPYAFLFSRLATAAASFFLFGAVWYITKGIGLGDVKYAALLGYLLGPDKLVITFIVTALLSVVIYLAGVTLFHWTKTKKIPYAPFLSAGAAASLFVNYNPAGGVI